MISEKLEKLLLSELRIVVFHNDNKESGEKGSDESGSLIPDEQLTKAVTVNEELRNLGYLLKPADVLRLAGSSSLDTFAQHFRTLVPDVKAPPMYPGFPEQVMKMTEAEFRLHQLIHYFSTYGLEKLLGVEISKGWLPYEDSASYERNQKDDALLNAKVLELLSDEKAPAEALRRVLEKRQRMTASEMELVTLAIPYLEPEELAEIRVPFKENLALLFAAILDAGTVSRRLCLLRQICQHTGDVLKCTRFVLARHHYHLRTSQKRAIVKLLERYPAEDFRANLILSGSKREGNLIVLKHLDFNYYSRSDAHKEAVRALRNGDLRSWESRAKYLLTSGNEGALDFVAKRPGMMLRMLRWLLRLGYPEEEIRRRLLENCGSISLHTIVDILNSLERRMQQEPREELFRVNLQKMEEDAAERIQYWENWAKHLNPENPKNRDILPKIKRSERAYIDHYIHDYNEARALYEKSAPYMDTVCRLLKDLLYAHLEQARTDLYGKKVFLQAQAYDLKRSRMKGGGLAGTGAGIGTGARNTDAGEGGYLPAGIAIRIPDEVRYLRFFVYWNDPKRVDVDLHAQAHDLTGEAFHVGWDADFRKNGVIHSGDITHSNAAEYIDINLDASVRDVITRIHIYAGKDSFKEIRECYVGMMAVKKLGKKRVLYDPKNCFFTHELRGSSRNLHYGYVDVKRRLLFFIGGDVRRAEGPSYTAPINLCDDRKPVLSMAEYLDILFGAQKVCLVESTEEADVVLTIEKSAEEKSVSLQDRNFYLEV